MRVLGKLVLCLFAICLEVREAVTSATGTDARNLRTKLFVTDAYDKKVRPNTNQSDPTEVNTSFYLLSINELDEVTETLKTTGYLYLDWYDSYLTWNASDYGGLTYSFFPQDDVWKPDVALKNSVVEYKQLGVDTLNVQVDNNGLVSWYPFQTFKSSCSVDITYFPYDVQTCKLIFVAWSYSKLEHKYQTVLEAYRISGNRPYQHSQCFDLYYLCDSTVNTTLNIMLSSWTFTQVRNTHARHKGSSVFYFFRSCQTVISLVQEKIRKYKGLLSLIPEHHLLQISLTYFKSYPISTQVDMYEGTTGISLDEYSTNSVWEIINTNAYVEQETYEASVIFSMTLKRKPLYTILNIVFPSIMLAALNVFVFVLPCSSGEKAGYAITVFLAFAVFLTIVSDSLPQNSDAISLFSVYLIIQTVQSTIITVLAMLMIRISYWKTPVPRALVYLVNLTRCKVCSSKAIKVAPVDKEKEDKSNEKDTLGLVQETSVVGECEEDVTYTQDNCDWETALNALDIVFLIFFGLISIISTAVCLGAAQAATK